MKKTLSVPVSTLEKARKYLFDVYYGNYTPGTEAAQKADAGPIWALISAPLETAGGEDYTVTMHPGAMAAITAAVHHLQALAAKATVGYATDFEDLKEKQETVIKQQASLLRALHQVLLSNAHDGNVQLWKDSEMGLFFRYDSDYHGGLVFHNDAKGGTWSVHT